MIYHVAFYFSKAFDIVYIDAIQKLDFCGIRGIAKDCFISVFYHLHGQTIRRRRMSMSSIKRQIRRFHVVVVQWT